MKAFAFWNNKGGTGKTSLAFQATCGYAKRHSDQRILVIDACPQANLSELFLGGLMNSGSDNLLQRQGLTPRCTIGGYFQIRLPSPYALAEFQATDFITRPSEYNRKVPENVALVCGDPLLELQANAINTLANTQIPGTDTWIGIMDWLKDVIDQLTGEYDVLFLDANPSFAIYTQIALSIAELLVLPVMADDSSRRAIQNAFSLIYGLKLPSEIYSQYAFATKLRKAGRSLPRVHLIAKNRLTQYMGSASAYNAVLQSIDGDVKALMKSNPDIFSFEEIEGKIKDGVVDIRDFQTTGVVAFARGCPFYALQAGRLYVGDRRVRVNEEYRMNCIGAIDALIDRLEAGLATASS